MALSWNTWRIGGNTLHDLRDESGRIWARLKQTYLGAWELWDWRRGSLNEVRLDTYRDPEQAKREGLQLFGLSLSAEGKHP
jgi:hypothetical protein